MRNERDTWGLVVPSWRAEAEPITAAVNDRRITPMQGFDLLTDAICNDILDNAASKRAGRG